MKKFSKLFVMLVIVSIMILPASSTSLLLGGGDSGDVVSSVDALNYSTAPNHLYPFIYQGEEPFAFLEFAVSDCVVGCLYIYDKDAETLIKVTDDTVVAYTATKGGIYYVTAEYTICYAPYGVENCVQIGCAGGAVSSLDYFAGVLSFVEDECRIVLLDVSTGDHDICLTAESITTIYQFDQDKLIWRDEVGNPNYLNTATGISTVLNDELEVNCLLAPYISEQSANTRSVTENVGTDPLYNDIVFPLAEYPATPLTYNNSYPTATSYFNEESTACNHSSYCRSYRYGNHTQCFGFAIYAHDKYMHLYSASKFGDQSGVANPEGWDEEDFVQCAQVTNNIASVAAKYRFSDADTVKAFFEGLHPGAYIRYGRDDDIDAWNGAHSVVVASIEDEGVWVYECNVDSKCGVYYVFYRYDYLDNGTRFTYVHNYVSHTFGDMEYENTSTHKNGCENCDGYLRQPHTNVSAPAFVNKWNHRTAYGCCNYSVTEEHTVDGVYSYVSANQHSITFSCCGGNDVESHTSVSGPTCENKLRHKTEYVCCGHTVPARHNGTARYLVYSLDAHMIEYSCCSGYFKEEHTFTSGSNPVCTGCGKPKIEGLRKNAVVVDLELVEVQGE